jgi:hypothetical protein
MNSVILNRPTTVSPVSSLRAPCAHVSWGAIFAGLATALAMQLVFTLLGAGLGFAIYHPLTETNPVKDLATGSVVVQGVSAVFSLWFGGWVAGRFARRNTLRAGWLHGFLVWATGTVAAILLASAGAGWALGDLSKLVGGGLSAAGKPLAAAAGGATEVAKDALQKTRDTVSSYVDEAASGQSQDSSNRSRSIRAKREIGLAATRYFAGTEESARAANRTALVTALVNETGASQADAERTVADWTASYDRVKADLAAAKNQAEARAREVADQAAKELAILSLGAFVGLILGGLAASVGGHHGAKHAFLVEPYIAEVAV